jgi:hypothetical protein
VIGPPLHAEHCIQPWQKLIAMVVRVSPILYLNYMLAPKIGVVQGEKISYDYRISIRDERTCNITFIRGVIVFI